MGEVPSPRAIKRLRPGGLYPTQCCPHAAMLILVRVSPNCFPTEYFITILGDRPVALPHCLDEEMGSEKVTASPKAVHCGQSANSTSVPTGHCARVQGPEGPRSKRILSGERLSSQNPHYHIFVWDIHQGHLAHSRL